MAFQDEDEVGGKMSDESFLEKAINQKIRLVAGLYNEIDDRKKAIKMLAERHAKLEAEKATYADSYDLLAKQGIELQKENSALKKQIKTLRSRDIRT